MKLKEPYWIVQEYRRGFGFFALYPHWYELRRSSDYHAPEKYESESKAAEAVVNLKLGYRPSTHQNHIESVIPA